MKKFRVKIEAGYWMQGTHTFRTKREAMHFIDKWIDVADGDEDAVKNIKLID